jgi:hypothetical protein
MQYHTWQQKLVVMPYNFYDIFSITVPMLKSHTGCMTDTSLTQTLPNTVVTIALSIKQRRARHGTSSQARTLLSQHNTTLAVILYVSSYIQYHTWQQKLVVMPYNFYDTFFHYSTNVEVAHRLYDSDTSWTQTLPNTVVTIALSIKQRRARHGTTSQAGTLLSQHNTTLSKR